MIKYQKSLSYVLYGLLIVYYFFSIIFIRPGLFLGDSAFQYYEFLTGHYTDWQPPMMNLGWSLFRAIASPFIIHISIFVFSVYLFVSAFLKDNQPVRAVIIFIILMNPLVSFSMFNVLKDNAMMASLIFISAILYQYSRAQLRFTWVLCIITPFIVYAFGVRQNAVFSICPLLFFLFFKDNKKFLNFLIACLCAFFSCFILFLINYFVTYSVYAAHKDYPEVIMMKYDLTAIECFTHHQYKLPNSTFAEPEKETENRRKLCEDFSVKQSDSLFWWTPENRRPVFRGGVTFEQYKIIKSEWSQTIPRHLLEYLEFRAQVFGYSLVHANWYLGAATHDEYGFKTSMAKPHVYNAVNKVYMASCYMVKHYFGLIVLCLNIALLLVSIFKSSPNTFKICLLLSGLCYELMWFFILPVPDARYFLWFYIATFVSFTLPNVREK